MTKPATEERVAHTPGKWEVIGVREVCVMGENWAHICVVSNPRKSSDEDSRYTKAEPVEIGNYRFHEACANAAFIVTACNSFDQLVDALRAAEFAEKLVDAYDARAIIALCESVGDYESAGYNREQVIAKYEAKAVELRRAALSLATQKENL